jgi:acetyl esterase/lipase
MKVAAVVNWFGITDVADLLEGPNAKHYAMEWLGALPNRKELARALSPLTMVRRNGPPVLTVHGDVDALVPYSHAVRLHEALQKAGVANRLVTIPKGGHGDFSKEQNRANFVAIWAFLGERGLLPNRPRGRARLWHNGCVSQSTRGIHARDHDQGNSRTALSQAQGVSRKQPPQPQQPSDRMHREGTRG